MFHFILSNAAAPSVGAAQDTVPVISDAPLAWRCARAAIGISVLVSDKLA